MGGEQISTMAKLYAERLMRGDTVSEDEMRVIIAGLMLSVDKLANAFSDMQGGLWSEDKMRGMIAEEVEKHCAGKKTCPEKVEQSATWVGRMIRSIFTW